MGGELVCHSVYGQGSEFIFTLTQKIVDASPIGSFNAQNEESTIQGPYIPEFIAPDADILVADANETNLQIIKNLLKGTKIFVTTATNAEDSLEKLRKSFFNIAVIDQKLILNQEKEFIDNIREKNPDLPVYIITEKQRLHSVLVLETIESLNSTLPFSVYSIAFERILNNICLIFPKSP